MNELFQFLRIPIPQPTPSYSFRQKIIVFFSSYLFSFIFIVVSGFFILLIEFILKHQFQILSPRVSDETLNREFFKRFGFKYTFLIIVLLGPLYEELSFRLYLRIRKYFIATSLALIVYGMSGPVWSSIEITWNFFCRICLSFGVFWILIYFLPGDLIEKLKSKYFKYVFYGSALLFGLIHISNFAPLNHRLLFLYPIFVLPQIGMGLALGYVRLKLKDGLIWAVLLHSFINLLGFFFQTL